MSTRENAPLPSTPFALLIVEGGDEVSLCRALNPGSDLVFWNARGRDNITVLAALAAKDPNIAGARSVSVLLDVEEDAVAARSLAFEALKHFDPAVVPALRGLNAGLPR